MNVYLLKQNKNKETLIHEERKHFRDYKNIIQLTDKDRVQQPQASEEASSPKRKSTYRNSIAFDSASFLNQISNLQHQEQRQQGSNRNVPKVIEDQFRLTSLLDMQCSDEEVNQSYHNDPTIKFVASLFSEEDKFISILQHSGYQKISFIFEKLRRVILDHNQLFQMIVRLKQLIRGALKMSESHILDQALEQIIKATMECLKCDRATCFVVDEQKNELWSKVAKGLNRVIRLPINQGVVGFAATNKELVNIANAYADQRFNKEFDKISNYKTETILASPIMLKNKCIGVIQCINKLSELLGSFSKEDELLIQIICDYSRVILGHALSNDEQLVNLSKLRHCVKSCKQIRELIGWPKVDLVQQGQKILKSLVNADMSRIVLTKGNKQMIYYQEEGQEVTVEGYQGIFGKCIQEKRLMIPINCYNYPNYSPLIDIDTQLPVVVVPIMFKDKVYGAFMVPNLKGISTYQVQQQNNYFNHFIVKVQCNCLMRKFIRHQLNSQRQI